MAKIDVTQLTLRGLVRVACPYCGKPCDATVDLALPKRADFFSKEGITEWLQIVECFGPYLSPPALEIQNGCNRRFVVYLGSAQVTAAIDVRTSAIQAELESASPP